MASISNKPPATPRLASRRRAAVDRRLDIPLFKALSDPTRARLLACLVKCGRPCSVSEVADCCAVDFSVVARHLSLMARADILTAEKKGRSVWYIARCRDLSERFRALADAIDEWCPSQRSAREEHSQSPAHGTNCCSPDGSGTNSNR